MPWCPKCKSEYREGFTVCSDCGGGLVDDETFERLEEEAAEQLEEERRRALAAYVSQAFGDSAEGGGSQGAGEPEESLEPGEAEEPEESLEPEEIEPAIAPRAGGAYYEDSGELASENRSSAWVLLSLGGGGLGIIGLSLIFASRVPFASPYIFCGAAVVCLLFLSAGAASWKNARIFEKKAESEDSLRDAMLRWCRENLRAEELDREIGAAAGESEEILFFKRTECVRAKLNRQFVNLDQALLDRFIDDAVYDMIFTGKEGPA